MAFGVTTTGFVLKRLEDIEAEVKQGLVDAFGQIDTDADSTFGQIIGVMSFQIATVWEQMESVYNAMYPSTAEGTSLDNAASFTALTRLAAAPSTVVVQMKGTQDTVVPSGTGFSQTLTSEVFNTTADATIDVATCHRAKITVTSADAATVYTVTIDGTAVAVTSVASPTLASIAEQLKVALEANTTVGPDITVTHGTTDDFIVVTTSDIVVTNSFAPEVGAGLEITEFWSPVAATAVTASANPVPVGSIITVATPVSGLEDITNITEGTTGRDVETDAAFRIRRRLSLNITGAGTLTSIVARVLQDVPEVSNAFIFENSTGVVDSYGRPPHSFELIVAALNTAEINQAIGDKIWERKPAGITAYGVTPVTVVDGNGNNQTVSFSHATPKYVWVQLTCSISGADQAFPVNGTDTIKAAVVDFGEGLSFGNDLLVQQFAALGFAAGGVVTVAARLAVTDDLTPPSVYSPTNISIAANNYPSFDVSRVGVILA